MYSFGSRPDTEVLDEPLFGHFLRVSGVHRPSREEVLATMSTDVREITDRIHQPLAEDHQIRFLKNMACHLRAWPVETLAHHVHLLLIRHPVKVLRSYRAHMESPTLEDLGYAYQLEWREHCEESGWPVAVLDSDQIVQSPESSLRALCNFCGIPWRSEMMHWPAGGRKEDGVWAKYWYHRVHATEGWMVPTSNPVPQTSDLPVSMQPLLDLCMPLYERLKVQSLV